MNTFNKSSSLIEHAIDSTNVGMIIFDENFVIHYVNKAFCNITGYNKDEVINQSINFFKSEQHPEIFYEKLWSSVQRIGKWEGEMWNSKKNGEMYAEWLNISKIESFSEGNVPHYIATVIDLTEQKLNEQLLFEDFQLSQQLHQIITPQPISNERIEMSGVYVPATLFGGDMYAWFQIDEHRYSAIIIDVMGKGVAASFICMSIRSVLEELVKRLVDPEKVLAELNAHMWKLFRQKEDGMPYFFTSIYFVIDTKKRQIEYVNAGHPPGLFYQDKETVIHLNKGGVAVGMLPEVQYKKSVLPYQKTSNLLLFTDGFIESANMEMEDHILSLETIMKEQQDTAAGQLSELVLTNHLNQYRVEDDLCLISISIH
ncbi:SpoIIE family protein phosphatase [Bacillus tianshenii]|nr:SpoIIE family protein phosphatase [Bacillus tianshenii]